MTVPQALPTSAVRRRAAALAGHRGDTDGARAAMADPEPGVRATGLAALARTGGLTPLDLGRSLADPSPAVRRRAAEVTAAGHLPAADTGPVILALLDDADASVVEVAAWALGEISEVGPLPAGAVAILSRVATTHDDALAREAAVAALGAIGDPAGLPAVLAGTTDKPAVRRRAVLALAPFEGPGVDAALRRAAGDRDWQVRDAAEILRRESEDRTNG